MYAWSFIRCWGELWQGTDARSVNRSGQMINRLGRFAKSDLQPKALRLITLIKLISLSNENLF